ncbi:MAG: MEKHLA domain-containing protein [Sedimenticola thiotaurini]|uniref:MEKHLA domain-containing protein n=1 Tax=Sedimenticola thiotaurini TaxID=1543721 RepID=A0A558D3R2_9GAMM|nr:MAG: MEKHLA domain-containing protein [Sedimenticola thiotaurini]
MSERQPPTAENSYREDHAILLYNSFYQLTGNKLIDCPLDQLGERLFLAPFAVVSHDTSVDPVFNYANQTALDLFEMNWQQFTSLPSRLSAEQPLREERERLLNAVTVKGYIDDYTGIRIARTGVRFYIENAFVWNLDENNNCYGQAAMFTTWRPVD